MTRRSWIILLLLLAAILFGAGIYLPKIVNGQNNTKGSSASNANKIIHQQGDLKLVFEHTGSMSQSFMLIGIALYNGAEIKKRPNNAFVAGIPLAKAKELLRKYPSMRRCGAPGSEEAKRAVHNLSLLIDSSTIKRTTQEAKDRFDSALRRGDGPICLKVSGSVFQLETIYDGNEPIEIGNDTMELVQPTELEMIPCMQLIQPQSKLRILHLKGIPMPYIFKSKAHSDILMLDDNALQILEILGKDNQKKGIIEPQDIPAAIQALEQAIAQEQQSPAAEQGPVDQAPLETSTEDVPVLLAQRVWPFLEMLKASYAAQTPVVWGV